jgi:hypothetical protein
MLAGGRCTTRVPIIVSFSFRVRPILAAPISMPLYAQYSRQHEEIASTTRQGTVRFSNSVSP